MICSVRNRIPTVHRNSTNNSTHSSSRMVDFCAFPRLNIKIGRRSNRKWIGQKKKNDILFVTISNSWATDKCKHRHESAWAINWTVFNDIVLCQELLSLNSILSNFIRFEEKKLHLISAKQIHGRRQSPNYRMIYNQHFDKWGTVTKTKRKQCIDCLTAVSIVRSIFALSIVFLHLIFSKLHKNICHFLQRIHQIV